MITKKMQQKIVVVIISILAISVTNAAQPKTQKNSMTAAQEHARNEALWQHYDWDKYPGRFAGFTMNLQQIAVLNYQPAIRVQVGPAGYYKGCIVLMPNSDLIATPMNPDNGKAVVYKSKDKGLSWKKIAEPNDLPGKEHCLAVLSDGTLLHMDYNGNLSRSEDGGKTWNIKYTQLIYTDPDTKQKSFLHLTRNIEEMPDGTLKLVISAWEDEPEVITKLYTCTSKDRGYTWEIKKGSVETGYPLFKGYNTLQPSERRNVVNTVNGSGLNPAGLLHNTGFNNMWVSSSSVEGYTNLNPGTVTGPAWIRFDFAEKAMLDSMRVWNSNQTTRTGRGLRNVTIEYSVTGGSDSSEWKKLGDYEFAEAPGKADYPGFSAANFGGAQAKYVVITAKDVNGNWGYIDADGCFYGLSEVRFFTKTSGPNSTKPAISNVTATASGENPWYVGRLASPEEPSWLTLPDGRMVFIGRAEQARIIDDYTPPFLYDSYTETGDNMIITESSDNGKTWSMPKPFTNYGECHGYLTLLKDGRLLCTYANYHLPYGIFAIVSYDMGKTWDKDHPIQLALSANEYCGWPVTLQLPNGSMITSYATQAYLKPSKKGRGAAFQIVKWQLPQK